MADEKEKEEAKPAVEEAAAPAAAEEGANAKPRSGMLLLIIIGVALILVSAAVTYVVVSLSIPASMKAPPKDKSHSLGPVVVPVKDIIVNIADTKGTRLLKIVPHLVVSEEALAEILKKSEAMVRDHIGAVAGKMTIDDLEGVNGRSMLKNDIISRLNGDFKDKMAGTITDVYFEEYLIQ